MFVKFVSAAGAKRIFPSHPHPANPHRRLVLNGKIQLIIDFFPSKFNFLHLKFHLFFSLILLSKITRVWCAPAYEGHGVRELLVTSAVETLHAESQKWAIGVLMDSETDTPGLNVDEMFSHRGQLSINYVLESTTPLRYLLFVELVFPAQRQETLY